MVTEINPTAERSALSSEEKTGGPPVIVVDFGKAQSKKRVKRLRKGEGKLLERVQGLVKELVKAGTIQTTAQPLVVVVRERKKVSSPFGFMK